MHPVTTREHPGVRDTPGSASADLLSALGLTIIAAIDLIASLMYGFGVGAR